MSEQVSSSSETNSGPKDISELIPGYSSVEQFTKDGFKVLLEAIRTSNSLPSGRDWDFYNLSESFKKIMSDEGNTVMSLMNQVMRSNSVDSNIRNRVLDEKIELVIEANDVILEKVANNIDDLNGIKKTLAAPVVLQTVSAQLPVNGSWNRPNAATFSVNSTKTGTGLNCIKLITAKNIVRPQKFFKDKIDNRNKVPWYPRITDKPNSLKPLSIFLEECGERQEYSHPYEFELERFAPTKEQLLNDKITQPKNVSDTPLIEISTVEKLNELVETLRTCKEFAVDVEHHSYRTFMGLTCLLQISTQDTDYLIDTLALRDKLHILNEVFTKNTIVKIFHGADRDVEWLQRDLSIYVVNMFDTHQAAKALQYQALSLAFLLKKFCNVVPNKQFQLADWRIRPLPEELKQYAREDTHYLIYIYKMLKKELLAKGNKDNLLKSVIDRSTEICKTRYFKPILTDESHLDIYRKCKKMFDNRQMYALKEIYAWRDMIAREEDESLGYVLPNHMLLQISETLPREMQGILACCNPIPPLVRSNLLELHQIILKAREQSLEKAIMTDTTGRGVLKKMSRENFDSLLHCPHDLTKNQEFRDDLPVLLNNKNVDNFADLAVEKSPTFTVFSDSGDRKPSKKLHGKYFSPFERYKLVKPFVVAKEQEQKEENKEEVTVNERTDEDRVASVRDHFLQLSKKFSDELQVQQQKDEEQRMQKEQSLIEMGGSRKRKRQDYVEDDLPTKGFDKFYRGRTSRRKRKFDEISGGNVEEGQNKSKKKRNKNKNNQWNNGEQMDQHFNQAQQDYQQKPKRFNRRRNNQQQNEFNQSQPNYKKQFKKKPKQRQQNDFVPYDYASVDFRQFQGGGGSANTGAQIKQKFKPKNRKNKNNKKGAKSSTFGNIKLT